MCVAAESDTAVSMLIPVVVAAVTACLAAWLCGEYAPRRPGREPLLKNTPEASQDATTNLFRPADGDGVDANPVNPATAAQAPAGGSPVHPTCVPVEPRLGSTDGPVQRAAAAAEPCTAVTVDESEPAIPDAGDSSRACAEAPIDAEERCENDADPAEATNDHTENE